MAARPEALATALAFDSACSRVLTPNATGGWGFKPRSGRVAAEVERADGGNTASEGQEQGHTCVISNSSLSFKGFQVASTTSLASEKPQAIPACSKSTKIVTYPILWKTLSRVYGFSIRARESPLRIRLEVCSALGRLLWAASEGSANTRGGCPSSKPPLALE
eukprot:678603-Rhodomonas_salina.2